MQYKVTVSFINEDGANFHEIFKIFVVINQKPCCIWAKICMGGKTHRYYKHTKFRHNLRGDPKFLVDLTWNDPIVSYIFHCSRSTDNIYPFFA